MMKINKLAIAVMAALAPMAFGQEVQCVEVPAEHKIVFVPWFVPTKELIWKWHPASDPVQEDSKPCGELGVSPSTCEID